MTSQLVISKFFCFFSVPPPDPESEKIRVIQLIKKFWPYKQMEKLSLTGKEF